jgi:ankyrin repeat protein
MDIIEAIKSGDRNRAAELLTADPAIAEGRTAEGVSYIALAMYHRQPDIASLLAAPRNDLDIYEACTMGYVDRVRELVIAHPALVNNFSPDGFTPVALAAYFGQPDVVEVLINAGADVNIQARNPMKVAAIHAAVAARNTRIVKMLLHAGADPNLQQQQGYTPLQAAMANDDQTIVELLKAYGAH